MLDTGIDVPEVVNLMSYKTGFYLFDYCQNLEFFAANPEVSDGASGESLGAKLFKARLALIGGCTLTYESPFTDINQQGPDAVFAAAKVEAMVQVLRQIRARAVA